MDSQTTTRVLVAGGGFGVAATTAAEIVTAPYSDWVSAYALNPTVHVLKVVAVLVFAAGMWRWRATHRELLGRTGRGAALAVGLAPIPGAVPYSVLEASLPAGISAATADERLEAAYAGGWAFVGPVSSVGLVGIILGLVVLAVVAIRRGVEPRWVPVGTLAALPTAIGLTAAGAAAHVPMPHPPTWLFLALAGYALVGAGGTGQGRTRRIRSSASDGDPRPSRFDVVTHR